MTVRTQLPPTLRHAITIGPRPKMDARNLVAAVCSCGDYDSGPVSIYQADTSAQQHVAAATVNDARAVIGAGLAWLFDTVQPDGAACFHLGPSRDSGDRLFGFIPSAQWPILTMDLVHPEYDDRGNLTNPLTRHDVDTLWADMKRRGITVRSSWNGKGTHTVSLALAGHVHPTLLAAVETYRRGCPHHGGSVFCGREHACTYLADRYALLTGPAWPDPQPAPPQTNEHGEEL